MPSSSLIELLFLQIIRFFFIDEEEHYIIIMHHHCMTSLYFVMCMVDVVVE